VVFDSDTGDFRGVIVGGHLGAMRTGAIGGVAIKHMARPDASRAAILGSGRQARTHLEAAAAVRHFASVKVYSPNATHREAFAREMRETLDLPVDAVVSAHEAVADADVVMCVTTSTTPVFDPSWLKPAPSTGVPTSNQTGNATARLDHMAREGGNDASDDDPHR
jgi:ornithine cyclodeaminase